jgi:hypothetical protein
LIGRYAGDLRHAAQRHVEMGADVRRRTGVVEQFDCASDEFARIL